MATYPYDFFKTDKNLSLEEISSIINNPRLNISILKNYEVLINDYIRESSKNIAVITDVRYAEYEKDEIFWVKNILGGKLIHISMIDNGKFVPPANIDEEKNDPIIKENTDLFIEWEKEPNFSLKSSGLNKYVKTVEQFIKKQI
jgi:hypothetical protein